MNKFKTYTFTVLFSTLAFTQTSRAAAITSPLTAQTNELVQLFTGFFDNSQQVASNPLVPPITISTCNVQATDTTKSDATQYVYLEQKSSGFERIRFYTFTQGNSTVDASIQSFVNPNILSGLCNKPEQQRAIDSSNLIPGSCDLVFTLESSRRYTGKNASVDGCPTSTGGKVISTLTIFDSGIDSVDKIFDNKGNLLVNTPIKFDKISSIPEPSLALGLLAFSISVAIAKPYK
jgi:hypothetical protein